MCNGQNKRKKREKSSYEALCRCKSLELPGCFFLITTNDGAGASAPSKSPGVLGPTSETCLCLGSCGFLSRMTTKDRPEAEPVDADRGTSSTGAGGASSPAL